MRDDGLSERDVHNSPMGFSESSKLACADRHGDERCV